MNCLIYPAGALIPGKKPFDKKLKYFWRLIIGTAKDGRSIMIYPIPSTKIFDIPMSIREILQANHDRGALAGVAANIGDAFDIVFADELQYPRKRRTFIFELPADRHKGDRHGASEEE